MCGITGTVAFRNAPTINIDTLGSMVNTLYHRGPDESGMNIIGGAAMGMRRLSIIDLSGGSQPIYNEDKTIWTVYNGEIYNFPDLRNELKSRGHIFKTNTDTEVIVHGYEEYGPEFPKYLNGIFAIALHDSVKQKFLLVRDHLGIKPLYYSFKKDYIVFGSEIKAILKSGLVDKELDLDALSEFLSWEYIPGKSTLIKSVKKLEPGEMIEIDLHRPVLAPKAYWDIPEPDPNISKLSAHDWEDLIDQQIKSSVKRQLISDVPLGAFLSGGVDSSLIVSAMGNAETFSIGFDDPTYNELKWARKVADHLKLNHKDEIIKPNIVELFSHLMHFLDDPIGDFSIFPTYLVSKLARRHVTVALSGDGGDELFGGYETYLADNKAASYNKIPPVLRRNLIEPILNSLKPTAKKKGLVNKAKRFIEGLEHPAELYHARWRYFLGETIRTELFSPEAHSKISSLPAQHIINLFERAGNRGMLDKNLYVDVKSYLCDNILTKVDRMSMAVSLEARVPYLDPDVVKLAFNVPENLKVNSNETKIILKKLASRYVPRECIYRPKEGFSIPIKNWLNVEFKPIMEELLNSRSIEQDGIFQYKTVERLKKEHSAGIANHSHILWSLIVFYDWKKRWLESPIPQTTLSK
ncbi:MAG TPA: asparagine synthase (glutamine-hydrolyzing) [Ignavibacteriaceae bacterium]|nr:asparagine synthase (glutamine-hydrolyzing) [Ignavibacteriaceae bacterium]